MSRHHMSSDVKSSLKTNWVDATHFSRINEERGSRRPSTQRCWNPSLSAIRARDMTGCVGFHHSAEPSRNVPDLKRPYVYEYENIVGSGVGAQHNILSGHEMCLMTDSCSLLMQVAPSVTVPPRKSAQGSHTLVVKSWNSCSRNRPVVVLALFNFFLIMHLTIFCQTSIKSANESFFLTFLK
jgi:hypothetical protein